MIEQPPPELAKLIAAERAAPVASQAVRAAIRAKVAASVAGVPLGAAAVGATSGLLGAGKIIAIVAVVVGAGTVAVVKTQHRTPQTAHAAPLVMRAEPATPPPPVPPAAFESPAPAPVLIRTPAVPHPTALPPARATPAPSQAEMLQEAWADLSRGEASQALDLAARDEALHADGALSEERAALRIVALAKLGRMAEASQANAVFAATYPNSIHRSAIAHALAGGAP